MFSFLNKRVTHEIADLTSKLRLIRLSGGQKGTLGLLRYMKLARTDHICSQLALLSLVRFTLERR